MSEIITSMGPVLVKDLCGWGVQNDENATRELLRESFELWGDVPQFAIRGGRPYQAGKKAFLWEIGRKLLKSDPLNYAQQVGDCVSFGAKNAIEYMQFAPMASGQRLKWTMVYTPYLYGCGRVFIGGGRLGRQDGSLGVWQAQAVQKYGTIAKVLDGLPEYSGSVARQWGANPGPPDKWVQLGKERLVKTVALIKTWEDLVEALTNGYPVTIASNVGFSMLPGRDGFHARQGSWPHQMCIIGIHDDTSDPYGGIINSWGDVHGQVKDFETGELWPKGTIRARKRDIMAILSEQDSWAFSSFDGFPAQDLERADFELWK